MTGDQYRKASFIEKAVAWADSLVGIREHGPNKGADVEEITRFAGLGNHGGYAWCAMFVYYVLRVAGLADTWLPSKGNCAAVRNWVAWGREKGLIVDEPGRGRLFFWLGQDQQGHIGFCLDDGDSTGKFRTIEGNTNGGGSREGDGSYKRTRTKGELKKHWLSGYIDLGKLS